MLIREMAREDRPQERLYTYGVTQLSNAELLALLLRGDHQVEDATRLLGRFDGLAGVSKATINDLARELPHSQAVKLTAMFELGRRAAALRSDDKQAISSPADIAMMLMPLMSGLDREHLKVVLLNTKNQIVTIQTLYVGSVNAAIVRPAEVFAEAVRRTVPAIVVVHNHPSGDPTPSPEDVDTTSRLVEAGKLLDIDVLDHVVIGQGRFVSMRERRLGFV